MSPADDLFSDAMNTIISLREALQADPFDTDAMSATLTDVEDALDTVSGQLAVVGAKMARVTDATTRLETSQVNLKGLLSEVEDADLAEVAVLLTEQQLVYETALEVTGSIMQMSLLDFLD